jgi:hypothetical protein
MKTLVLAAALALAGAISPARAAQPAIEFSSSNGVYLDGFTRLIGWEFSTTSDVQVTALGWFDWNADGLARDHEVGLWRTDTQTLVASLVVPAGTGATLDGHFRWVDLATPLSLQAGTSYRIAGLDIGAGGDPHVWDVDIGLGAHVNGMTVNSALQLGAPGTALGGLAAGFAFPTVTTGGQRAALLGPNLALAVPEPSSAALLLGGALMLALRRPPRSKA